MRSRLPLYLFLFTGLSVVALPSLAHATVIPYWGPLVPPGATSCPAAWGSLVQLVNNLIAFGLTVVLAIVAPLMFAYVGARLIFSQGDPGARSEARTMALNLVVGIVLALAAYLIVDFLLTSLTTTGGLNAWTSQMFSNGASSCLSVKSSLSPTTGASGTPGSGLTANPTDPGLSTTGTGACNASTVAQTAASDGLSDMTDQEANILACVAGPESTCGTVNQNYSWNKGNAQGLASSAYGPFQVLLAGHSDCYDNPTCEADAGVNGPLNCKANFNAQGFTLPNAPNLQQCEQAASQLNCSTAAADCVYHEPGGATAWTADPNSSAQQQCLNNNGAGS